MPAKEGEMKVVTAEEMRIIDGKTMKKYGLSRGNPYGKAGLAVATKIRELFDKKKR
jgi:NAD(P)H-hydrate repair Nnr-like enzyme with NAD(P)H-hydrate epimerase domain